MFRRFGIIGGIASLALCSATAAAYDCDAGCNTKYSAVCGVNEITYINECVAVCQDIAVAAVGACSGDPMSGPPAGQALRAASATRSYVREDVTVTKEDMARFADEGFTFQSALVPLEDGRKVQAPRLDSLPKKTKANKKANYAVRITAEGLVYAQPSASAKSHNKDADAAGAYLTPAVETGAGNATRRNLAVFGVDSRFRVQDTTKFPMSAIGLLKLYDGRGGLLGYCSAAVISRSAILTAGHCASESGSFFSKWVFQPAAQGPTVPFGSFTGTYATTFSNWLKYEDFEYDMSVIHFAPKKGKYVGDVTGGWMGYSAACPQPAVTTFGYPGDKETKAGEPTQQGQPTCSKVLRDCSSSGTYYNYLAANCDSYFGQSGSPMYDSSAVVYAVTSFEYSSGGTYVPDSYFPNRQINGYNVITTEKYTKVRGWASVL